MRSRAIFLLLLSLGSSCAPGPGGRGGQPSTELDVGNDRYFAGSTLVLTEPLQGDLVGVAGNAMISGPVTQEVLFAGGTVVVDADVGDDVRIAGGDVQLQRGTVEGSAVMAGGTVRVAPESTVRQSLVAAGVQVTVDGTVDGGARLAGGRIEIGGHIQGPVELTGDTIILQPNARIDGDVTYSSPREMVVAPGAMVSGATRFTRLEQPRPTVGTPIALSLIISLGLSVIGLLLWGLFPRSLEAVADALERRPGESVGLGVAGLIGIPILAVICLVTVIGSPLSALGMLFWIVALLLARIFVSFTFARRIEARRRSAPSLWSTWGWMFLIIVVIGLLQAIPVIGWLVRLAVVLFGMGALIVALWQRHAPRRPRESARAPERPGLEPSPLGGPVPEV